MVQVLGQDGDETKLEDIKPGHLGKVQEVQVTKDDTLFLNGGGDSVEVSRRAQSIRDQIEETKSEYEKEKLQVDLFSSGVTLFLNRFLTFGTACRNDWLVWSGASPS